MNNPETDWAKTINNLLSLAKKANSAFEFDRAVNYLNLLEEIWDSKGLPGFSVELRLELHREKGKAYSSRGKNEEAIQEYKKILKFCRDSGYLADKAEIFSNIGQLMAKQGDHDRALGYLQRNRSLPPIE
jgi:tetratricopeptide (TPR) repeat protein